MIAVDTNLLVYAHRREAPQHHKAVEVLRPLVEGHLGDWAIPWPCVHEFIATVTRPLWSKPTPMEDAIAAVDALRASPRVELIGETSDHWALLTVLLQRGVSGPRVHDARIAAICLGHGVRALWTADRDFGSFPELVTLNPLVVGRS